MIKGREYLLEPIQADEIEWRVQSQTKNKDKLIIVPYINNRCVMERFDAAFGWDKWNNEFVEVKGFALTTKDKSGNDIIKTFERGFICVMKVDMGERIVVKSDTAETTAIESLKGGISDSMKRVAVQFGLGRCLYNYPKVMIETTDKYIPDWVKPRLDAMVSAINEGKFKKDVVIFKNDK